MAKLISALVVDMWGESRISLNHAFVLLSRTPSSVSLMTLCGESHEGLFEH